jgi:hypothetical protein
MEKDKDRDRDREKDKDRDKDQSWAELLKKMASTGLGAALMTEDVVKGILSEMPMPKDAIGHLTASAKRSKEEILGGLKETFGDYLANVKLSEEIEKALDKFDIEVKATVSFKRKGVEKIRPKSEVKSDG